MDDDDEFMYGDAPSKQEPAPEHQDAPPAAADEEEDDVPYEPPEDDEVYDTPGSSMPIPQSVKAEDATANTFELDEDEDDEEDSDDDIEIVLDTGAPNPAQNNIQQVPSAPAQAQQANIIQRTSAPETKASPITRTQVKVGASIPRQDGTVAPPARPPVIQKAVVDVDEIGEFDGMELYNLDLESLDDKPWRRPGADITDFFNYGFNEQSWKAYCSKQKRMREEFAGDVGGKPDLSAPDFATDAMGIPIPHYPGMPRPGQFEMRAGGKRPREDDDGHEGGDDGRERHMRDPRFFPDAFNPDFGGPPPMGMFASPDAYGHMPPPFMPPDLVPGFDPYRQQRGPMPIRPGSGGGGGGPRGIILPPRAMRGDRGPFYPMDMEPPYRPPFGARAPPFDHHHNHHQQQQQQQQQQRGSSYATTTTTTSRGGGSGDARGRARSPPPPPVIPPKSEP
ncbi:Fip1 motif-domain-containing protein [Powellomyces hirtus]|nr:Fip1 motif-domain-containing protein [Powellomyces hirtus]